ncbi:MAG TPA: dolichyl-phosphate beta-glucosyltransferase [Candidatus Dormibacteraeota bacterium]|nr:dolichyl-phosphate beta-glucosyltransferase [Candidatus Dormibacteraeota bacterium]
MLSVVVPAYNEADRLPPTLEAIRRHLDGSDETYEVIVVDDGSRDVTAETAERLCSSWPQLEVIRLDRNRGKGAAVRAGMLRARGEHRLFSDADLSTPIDELPRLRAELRGRCAVAIASRGAKGARIAVHQQWRREFMGRTYNRLLRLLVLPGIHDSQCGFKVFTAEAAVACFEPLRTLRFGFDAEVLLRARRKGWAIAEVPVNGWRHVEASRVHAVRDSGRMLVDLARLRLRRLG